MQSYRPRLTMVDRVPDRFLGDPVKMVGQFGAERPDGLTRCVQVTLMLYSSVACIARPSRASCKPPRSRLTGDRPRAKARVLSIALLTRRVMPSISGRMEGY